MKTSSFGKVLKWENVLVYKHQVIENNNKQTIMDPRRFTETKSDFLAKLMSWLQQDAIGLQLLLQPKNIKRE